MLIDCKKTVDRITTEIKQEVNSLKQQGIFPTLAIIQVKGIDASDVYVRNKHKKCEEVGIESINLVFPNDVTELEIIQAIEKLNKNKSVHGIMVQLPLPKHIDSNKVINTIEPIKDADCLTVANIGKLFTNDIEDITIPCTPLGIMNILKDNVKSLEGLNALVINRSMLVGKPLIELLQRENATVTLSHSKTKNLNKHIQNADIIITAVGKTNFLNMNNEFNIYKDKIIIDVSMNRDTNGKLCGDVNKDMYDLKDCLITPVPGGVGTTTVISLLANTITCCKKQRGL